MSDEPDQKPDKAVGWSMPEPVFRSSEGRAPGKRPFEDSQAEIPTEPGFRDPDDDVVMPSVRREKRPTPPPTPSKGSGCARTVLSMVGIITLAVVAFIGLLIYLIFFYRSSSSTF